jgi:hypothetical protein
VLCPGLVTTNLAATTERAGVKRAAAGPARTGGIDPALAGDLVIEAIRGDWLHIVTHGEYRQFVAERAETVLTAFDRAPDRSLNSAPPGSDQLNQQG